MVQELVVNILFLASLSYLIFRVVKMFRPGNKCANCSACGTMDTDKMLAKMKEDPRF